MKSIVDKLSSRLEQVEKSGGNESGEVKDHEHEISDIKGLDTKLSGYALSSHTHKSSEISDVINEYAEEDGQIIADIYPDENIFLIKKYMYSSSSFNGRYYIGFPQTLRFTLKYKENTLDCTTSIPNTTFGDFEINSSISTKQGHVYAGIILPLDYEETISLELSNIKKDEKNYSDVVITCSIPKSKTDMRSQQIFTANAVQQYVKANKCIDFQFINPFDHNGVIMKLIPNQINIFDGVINVGNGDGSMYAHTKIVADGENILYIKIEPGCNTSIDLNDIDMSYFKIYRYRDNVDGYSYIRITGANYWGFQCRGYTNCCVDDEYSFKEDQITYEEIDQEQQWQRLTTEKIEDTDVNCLVIKPNAPAVIGENFSKLRDKVSTLEQKIADLEKKVSDLEGAGA